MKAAEDNPMCGLRSTSLSPEQLGLHPSDLADLRRSGLSDETIQSMGCRSLNEDHIRMSTGVKGVTSAGYCIPYIGNFDQTGAPYLRWRLREPVGGMRYVSGQGDDAQLYFPSALESLPPSDLLVVTEGEKKAAKAVQEGLHCVAVQGVWSWADPGGRAAEKMRGELVNENTVPLPALVACARRYKRVLVLGDSDLTTNHQAKSGFDGLARSLKALGVRVAVAYCPPVPMLEEERTKKQGLDDWLIADCFRAIRSLPALFRAAEVNQDGITDNYNAREIEEMFGDKLAFSQDIWRWWNGNSWTKDDCGKRRSMVPAIAEAYLSDAQHLQELLGITLAACKKAGLAKVPPAISEWTRPIQAAVTILRKSANAISNRRGIDDALAVAQSRLRVPNDAWDRDSYYLGVKNGVVDLRTGGLLPALPGHRITKCAGAEFAPEATAPNFMSFLERVQPDPGMRHYLQALAGYSSLGTGNAQKFFTFVGGGANGKSTFMGLLIDALGEYAVKGPISLLAEQSPDKPRNDLAALAGARLVSISECSSKLRLDAATIKAMTGEDRISARFLHHEFFEFRPCFTPIVDTNHPPLPRDASDGMWRRVEIVPWSTTIPPYERDRDLRAKLTAELPGILVWIIRGASMYLQSGLPQSPIIHEATANLRKACDEIGAWIDSCAVQGKQHRVPSAAFYQSFLAWSEREGNASQMTQKAFSLALQAKGFATRKIAGIMNWEGIALSHNGGTLESLAHMGNEPQSPSASAGASTSTHMGIPVVADLPMANAASGRLPGGGYIV